MNSTTAITLRPTMIELMTRLVWKSSHTVGSWPGADWGAGPSGVVGVSAPRSGMAAGTAPGGGAAAERDCVNAHTAMSVMTSTGPTPNPLANRDLRLG